MTRLAGKLPKGDNGLAAIAADMVAEPLKVRVIVALVDNGNTITNNDTGEAEATVRVREVEVITGFSARRALGLMREAFEERNPQMALPFETESDMRKVYDAIDADLLGPAGADLLKNGAGLFTGEMAADAPPPPDEPVMPERDDSGAFQPSEDQPTDD